MKGMGWLLGFVDKSKAPPFAYRGFAINNAQKSGVHSDFQDAQRVHGLINMRGNSCQFDPKATAAFLTIAHR